MKKTKSLGELISEESINCGIPLIFNKTYARPEHTNIDIELSARLVSCKQLNTSGMFCTQFYKPISKII